MAGLVWVATSRRVPEEAEIMTDNVDLQQLKGRSVAFLMADGVSLIELEEPHCMLEASGARVELVAPHYGEVHAMDYLDKAGTVPVDRALVDADPGRYDALVLPGGVASADHLRRDPDAVAFVAAFPAQGCSVAAICHAPWLLVEAGIAQGRTLTSWPSLRTDIRNAGGIWVDEPVHVDERLITGRGPKDLPAFCAALTTAVLEAPEPRQTATRA
jgi:protease I